jgi:hypothetical protein
MDTMFVSEGRDRSGWSFVYGGKDRYVEEFSDCLTGFREEMSVAVEREAVR